MDTDNFCHPYLQVKFNVLDEVSNRERERERERDFLQMKFNVSDEVSNRSEWFQCFRRISQNGFRVYRSNYTNL